MDNKRSDKNVCHEHDCMQGKGGYRKDEDVCDRCVEARNGFCGSGKIGGENSVRKKIGGRESVGGRENNGLLMNGRGKLYDKRSDIKNGSGNVHDERDDIKNGSGKTYNESNDIKSEGGNMHDESNNIKNGKVNLHNVSKMWNEKINLIKENRTKNEKIIMHNESKTKNEKINLIKESKTKNEKIIMHHESKTKNEKINFYNERNDIKNEKVIMHNESKTKNEKVNMHNERNDIKNEKVNMHNESKTKNEKINLIKESKTKNERVNMHHESKTKNEKINFYNESKTKNEKIIMHNESKTKNEKVNMHNERNDIKNARGNLINCNEEKNENKNHVNKLENKEDKFIKSDSSSNDETNFNSRIEDIIHKTRPNKIKHNILKDIKTDNIIEREVSSDKNENILKDLLNKLSFTSSKYSLNLMTEIQTQLTRTSDVSATKDVEWKDLSICQRMCGILLSLGYEYPSPVQVNSIPKILNKSFLDADLIFNNLISKKECIDNLKNKKGEKCDIENNSISSDNRNDTKDNIIRNDTRNNIENNSIRNDTKYNIIRIDKDDNSIKNDIIRNKDSIKYNSNEDNIIRNKSIKNNSNVDNIIRNNSINNNCNNRNKNKHTDIDNNRDNSINNKHTENKNTDNSIKIKELCINIERPFYDIVVRSKNGTGKTLTYVVPILDRLLEIQDYEKTQQSNQNNKSLLRDFALVIVPSHELALQVSKIFRKLSPPNITIISTYGGTNYHEDILRIKKGVSVIVGTPGRIFDLANKNIIELKHLRLLVMDEADRVLSKEMIESVGRLVLDFSSNRMYKNGDKNINESKIMKDIYYNKQILLFSATYPFAISHFINKHLYLPKMINLMPELTLKGLKQHYVRVEPEKKLHCLKTLISILKINKAVVFCNSIETVEILGARMIEMGVGAFFFHGNMGYTERNAIFHRFSTDADKSKDTITFNNEKFIKKKNEKEFNNYNAKDNNKKYDINTSRILIATDLLTRGIDIPQINVVINFEFPNSPSSYIHRIGRAGRFGQKGVCVSLVDEHEMEMLMDVEKMTGEEIKGIGSVEFKEFCR